MDVGEIDGRLFVEHRRHRLRRARRRRGSATGDAAAGFVGYAGITARALTSYVPPTLSHHDRRRRRVDVRAVLVTIANSAQFGNGALHRPGARVDDGLLDLVVVEERSRFATVCQLPRLFNGTVERVRGCTIRRIARGDDRSATSR